MNCNKCQKEIPEGGLFCPYCGTKQEETVPEEICETPAAGEEITEVTAEETAEETAQIPDEMAEEVAEEEAAPKKKWKLWQLIAVIAGGVVLVAILVGAILYGLGVDLKPRANDLYCKDSYTVTDEQIDKNADKVVATLGSKELTLGELQLYYMNGIYTFYSQYYSYLGYFNLDISQPLDTQYNPMSETEQTWQQYFLNMALSNWESYALLENLAEDEGYVPSQALQTQLDGMLEEINSVAVYYGYEDAQSYLDAEMAPGVSLDTYLRFNEAYYLGNEYLDNYYAAVYPTADEIAAYYAENEATFTEKSVTPDMGLLSSVRHILIQPEGGTEDESGEVTYSEEEWAAAYAEAERILEEWKAGAATEESFAELANTYSDDGGSNTTGGLYENISIDASYVENFRAWAVDAIRKTGDTSIVETEFGYHIMYFVEGEDYFTYTVGEQLVAERVQAMLLEAKQTYPMEVNYKKIQLFAPVFE